MSLNGFCGLFERGEVGIARGSSRNHHRARLGERRDCCGDGAGHHRSRTGDLAISVTGIAGPGGATATKPVGLVLFGLAWRDGACRTERRVFAGDRTAVRQAALQEALGLLEAEARN
jgi:hypothetical protein